jgi:FixJ family two-component response regulator
MSDDLVVVIDDDVSVRRALGNLLDSVGLTHLACAAPRI